jgi:glycosyltransferase involved in cell wall biosynthesis
MGRAMSERLPGISIVLPCLDEEANLPGAVHEALEACERYADDGEVIVVDDGSTDRTRAVATALVERHRRVRLVVHGANRGYGAAVRSGIGAARMPFVLLTDADRQFDLDQLGAFVPLVAEADLVVGYRRHRRDPVGRRVNGRCWNWLIRRLFRLDVRDVDCAFKLVHHDLLGRLDLTSQGALISTELLVKARLAGAVLAETGVDHRPRTAGDASGARPRVVLRAFRELRRLRASLRPT